MTESQTYDQCLAKMAQTCADAAKMVKLLEFAQDCPPQLLEDARKVKEASDDAMRGLVELRLGVV